MNVPRNIYVCVYECVLLHQMLPENLDRRSTKCSQVETPQRSGEWTFCVELCINMRASACQVPYAITQTYTFRNTNAVLLKSKYMCLLSVQITWQQFTIGVFDSKAEPLNWCRQNNGEFFDQLALHCPIKLTQFSQPKKSFFFFIIRLFIFFHSLVFFFLFCVLNNLVIGFFYYLINLVSRSIQRFFHSLYVFFVVVHHVRIIFLST